MGFHKRGWHEMNWALADRSLSSSLSSLLMVLTSNFALLLCLGRQQFLFFYLLKKKSKFIYPGLQFVLCCALHYWSCWLKVCLLEKRRCWEERNVHKAPWRVVSMFIWDQCHRSSFSFNRLIDLLLITQQFWFKNRLRLKSIVSILECNPTKPRSMD